MDQAKFFVFFFTSSKEYTAALILPDKKTPGTLPAGICILFEKLFRCNAKSGRNQIDFFQVEIWLITLATDSTAKARNTFTV